LETLEQNLLVTANTTVDFTVNRTLTDIDGNIYKTVKIGNQWWLAGNLRVTHYRNGESITNVSEYADWGLQTKGAWCYINNNSSDAAIYGVLYNWYALNDDRNIAPAGWHVPTDDEWKQLERNLGISGADLDKEDWRGTNEGGQLKEKGTIHWNSPNTGATNTSGFKAVPGGWREGSSGYFTEKGQDCSFWTASQQDNQQAWRRLLYYNTAAIGRYTKPKQDGLSVRLVRDNRRIPDTPSLALPENGATNLVLRPTLTWNIANEANTYTLQIALNSTFTNLRFTISNLTTTEYYVTGLTEGITYYWRVKAVNSLGESDWSEIWRFTTSYLEKGTLTDYDDNVYQTVKIGNQWWMAENLYVRHYRNGDKIPEVTENNLWKSLATEAMCFYDNNSDYAPDYGALYNWFTVNDSRNIAPEGWHVPTTAEWQTLLDYLGGYKYAGDALKEAGTEYWHSPNTNSTNETGFTARPAGFRSEDNGKFYSMGSATYFWSATSNGNNEAGVSTLFSEYSAMDIFDMDKKVGISVRLVRD